MAYAAHPRVQYALNVWIVWYSILYTYMYIHSNCYVQYPQCIWNAAKTRVHSAHYVLKALCTEGICSLITSSGKKRKKLMIPLHSALRPTDSAPNVFVETVSLRQSWNWTMTTCLEGVILFHSTKHDPSRKWVDPDGDQLADVWLGFDIFFNVSFTIELFLGNTWSFANVGHWPGGRVWRTLVQSDCIWDSLYSKYAIWVECCYIFVDYHLRICYVAIEPAQESQNGINSTQDIGILWCHMTLFDNHMAESRNVQSKSSRTEVQWYIYMYIYMYMTYTYFIIHHMCNVYNISNTCTWRDIIYINVCGLMV